jgi:hypothetical protein
VFSRIHTDGSERKFRVSGEPMFNRSSRFIGYRGIGLEMTEKTEHTMTAEMHEPRR